MFHHLAARLLLAARALLLPAGCDADAPARHRPTARRRAGLAGGLLQLPDPALPDRCPCALAGTLQVEAGDGSHGACAFDDGRTMLQAGVEPLANQPLNVTGVVAMLALHARAGLLRPEMRYTGRGHFTRIGTMGIDLHGDPPAGLPAGVQPHWALVSDDQAIAYPIAMAVG